VWTYKYSNELQHRGIKGMHWGKRKEKRINKIQDKKKMKMSTKVAIATLSVAAIAGLTYVGKKKFTQLMLKGAESSYNQMVPVRDKLSEVKSIRDQTLNDYIKYNKKNYDMGKLYFAAKGFKM
jgi:hypothetical protein